MLTTVKPSSFRPVEACNYSPEDLEFMRRAFRHICEENPDQANTEEQRDMLACAIMYRYQRGLSETDLITIALTTLH